MRTQRDTSRRTTTVLLSILFSFPPNPHLDRDEVGSCLVCDGLGHQRLPAPRRAVEQHAHGPAQAHGGVLLRELDGPRDGKLQLLTHILQRTHIGPADAGDG